MEFLNRKKKNGHQKNAYRFKENNVGMKNKVKQGIMKFNKYEINKINQS